MLDGSFYERNKYVLFYLVNSVFYEWLNLIRDTALLNLHRAYFSRALQELPESLPQHQFFPSVVAVYRSAWRIIQAVRIMWAKTPGLFSRMPLPWSHALS